MRKVHISDYANEQGVSTKTVYDWVGKGKVRHIKEKGERHTTTYILVDEEEDQVKHQVLRSNTGKEQNISLQEVLAETLETPVNKEFIETIGRFHDDYKLLAERNVELAELAGQTRLLMDSEHKTKEEYFKAIQENAVLKAKVETLQEKIQMLEEKQNNQTDTNSWLKKL